MEVQEKCSVIRLNLLKKIENICITGPFLLEEKSENKLFDKGLVMHLLVLT